MGAPPGNNFNPAGRPVGAVNKATGLARQAIAKFVDGNVERLSDWLDAIAEDDPLAAFNAFMSVVEYHIPKLARSETDLNLKITHDLDSLLRGRDRIAQGPIIDATETQKLISSDG